MNLPLVLVDRRRDLRELSIAGKSPRRVLLRDPLLTGLLRHRHESYQDGVAMGEAFLPWCRRPT
jgi:hypothetical protein